MRASAKSAIIAAAISLSTAAGPMAHAFDLNDYFTTYKATFAAYLKAKAEYDGVAPKYQFMRALLSFYGETGYVHWDVVDPVGFPNYCKTEEFHRDQQPAAFPEAAREPWAFVPGHSRHADLYDGSRRNAPLYEATQSHKYLHFGTNDSQADGVTAVMKFITVFPFGDDGTKAAVLSQVQTDIQGYYAAGGRNVFLGQPRDYHRAYQNLFGIDEWGGEGDMYTGRPARDLYGEGCYADSDNCSGDQNCVFVGNMNPGNFTELAYQYRCVYEDMTIQFPPEPDAIQCDVYRHAGWAGGDFAWQGAQWGVSDMEDVFGTYRATRDAYLKAANELKLATGPYKAARDAYVAATATYTKSLYE